MKYPVECLIRLISRVIFQGSMTQSIEIFNAEHESFSSKLKNVLYNSESSFTMRIFNLNVRFLAQLVIFCTF
jgi:hypothetical protein